MLNTAAAATIGAAATWPRLPPSCGTLAAGACMLSAHCCGCPTGRGGGGGGSRGAVTGCRRRFGRQVLPRLPGRRPAAFCMRPHASCKGRTPCASIEQLQRCKRTESKWIRRAALLCKHVPEESQRRSAQWIRRSVRPCALPPAVLGLSISADGHSCRSLRCGHLLQRAAYSVESTAASVARPGTTRLALPQLQLQAVGVLR